MDDREKVIKAIEDCVFHNHDCVDCDYDGCVFKHGDCRRDLLADALDLLKEQEDLGTELTNAVELIHKKNERIEKLLKEREAVGWIKVSDRLPFSSQMVLVSYPAYTDMAGNQYVEGVGIGYLITTATNMYWCRSDGTTFGELGFSSVNPIAWMPLPSPMKDGEQE